MRKEVFETQKNIAKSEDNNKEEGTIIEVTEDVRLPNLDIYLEKGERIKVLQETNESYYLNELNNLLPIDEYSVQVQLHTTNGQTKNINMNPEFLSVLTNWLANNDPNFNY